MKDPEIEVIIEEPSELEEEESYIAFLFDQYEDEDFKDYDLTIDPDEKMINWDDDDYEYYSEETTVPKYDD